MKTIEINVMIYMSLAAITIVVVGFVLFILHFQKTLKLVYEEKQQAQINFLNEINKTKIEIKDETLKKVANELHDNIGQILALTRIHIKKLQTNYEDESLQEVNVLTEKALSEIRNLSKLLNTDLIKNFSFLESLKILLESVQKMGLIKTTFEIKGDYKFLNADVELVLFRICQEFISNSLKYARCDEITLLLNYEQDKLNIKLKDNGIGFNTQTIKRGSGINNIYNRAKYIDATLSVESHEGEGTFLIINHQY